MNKKAIAILGVIFLLIVGTLGFLIFRKDSSEEDTTPPPVVDQNDDVSTGPTPAPTEVETDRAIRLTDDQAISPIFNFKGTGISYFNRQGQLFQTDIQISDSGVLLSNKRELTIPRKSGISRIVWPQAGPNYLAEFDNGSKKTWSFFDTAKSTYTDIPSQVYSLDWMPSGDKIMFVWVDNGKATLNIANPDTTAYQVLTDFYEPDNVISVAPDGKSILFHRTQSTDMTTNSINLVTADGKSFRSIIKDGYNQGIKWSPDSSKFLFTKKNAAGKFELWVANINTGEIRNLNAVTSVRKTLWSKDSATLFVAVPEKGTDGESLTEDIIYKINLATSDRQEFDPGLPADVQEMFVNASEDILFFRNAQDQALYYIITK